MSQREPQSEKVKKVVVGIQCLNYMPLYLKLSKHSMDKQHT